MTALSQRHSTTALSFLAHHRLDPIPAHYEVAYLHVADPGSALSRDVAGMADGGYRLSALDIATIRERHLNGAGAPVPSGDEERAATIHQTIMLESVAQDARSATSSFASDLGAFSTHDTPVAALVGGMIERAMRTESELASAMTELGRIRDELATARGDANRDALTELANRRAMEPILSTLHQEADGVAIALVDVDHFKRINDSFGHSVGDNVLRALAATLRDTCEGHHVARWGGEEFMVVMKGTPLETAHGLIDRARRAMARRDLKLRGSGDPIGTVTFSAGVAFGCGVAAPALIEQADSLCYDAKRAGRNLVCVG